MTDSDEEFLTIGVFARESGLTPSALRFYDDCGLLAPESIDAQSGYRYYTRAQSQRANIIRQLREIGLPLDKVAAALDAMELPPSKSWIDTSKLWLHRRGRQPRQQCRFAGCSTKNTARQRYPPRTWPRRWRRSRRRPG